MENHFFELTNVYTKAINFAMQQNHVPIIRQLVIKNTSDADLNDVTLNITIDPDIAEVHSQKIDGIPVGETLDIGHTINFSFSSEYLRSLTEQTSGKLLIELSKDNQLIHSEIYPIDILALNQWTGLQLLPEVTSTFVLPNHPSLNAIIRRAAEILQSWTGNPSFDEYQSKTSSRVKMQIASIYEAIAELQIIYCSAPASFGNCGQRLRLCDTVVSEKLGNCIDLSLLFASCVEAVGIHPLLVMVKGHAFAGAWLIEDTFPDSVNDDPSLLTKRLADGINEIVLVECTCMNSGQHIPFEKASQMASERLRNEGEFELFIDIKRSRYGGIRPIPLLVNSISEFSVNESISNRTTEQPLDISTPQLEINIQSTEVTKQRIWERKLLDLSLRNNLLNIRITKKTMQLISANLNLLEDALADGAEFQVLPKPSDWDNPLRSSGIYQTLNASDPLSDLIKQELSQKRIRTYLKDDELEPALTQLYRSSRLSIEENGANTLYLTIGLLKWYETAQSERARFAPIILLPIEIIRKSAQKGYVIRSRDEEPTLNITLLEMLRQDFNINIGGLDPLPKDDSGIDVKLILNTIRKAIMSQCRWDVEEQSMLGSFSFSKFIMWNDIHSNATQLCQNKIVSSLMDGKIEWEVDNTLHEVNNLDDFHPTDLALPISADSSQMEAIHASAKGKSFILHGPPGTGKSQTITNIIANALYNGKRVLFVAEKMAALSVVQKRLADIGLAPFCLELHSNKAQKSSVLEQLKIATEVSKKASSEEYQAEAEQIFQVRRELNDYVNLLHQKYHFGFSLFDSFTGYSQYKDFPSLWNSISLIETLSVEKLNQWKEIVGELKTVVEITSPTQENPWYNTNIKQFSPLLKAEIEAKLVSFRLLLGDLQEAAKGIRTFFKDGIQLTTEQSYRKVFDLIQLILSIENIPLNLLETDNLSESISTLEMLIQHGRKRDQIKDLLSKDYIDKIFDISAEQELNVWFQASNKWFLPKLLDQNKMVKRLSTYSKNGKVNKNDISILLSQLIEYQKKADFISRYSEIGSSALGKLWNNGFCDWEKVKIICTTIPQIENQIISVSESVSEIKSLKSLIVEEFSSGKDAFVTLHEKELTKYADLYQNVIGEISNIKELLAYNDSSISSEDWIAYWQTQCDLWIPNLELLRNWSLWNQVKGKASDLDLKEVVELVEHGTLSAANITGVFYKSLYHSCADYVLSKEPLLGSFNGKLFEDKIHKFKALCKRFEKLTQDEIYVRLASRIPSTAVEAAQSSEISILQRNIRNNGRATSLRKLFDSIPNLLQRIAPCMLMSPISVAQYLDVNNKKFDLVIFDEASQMPTSEAVGAIARGENVIVVGDPKQMPPTSFFSSNYVDEENIEIEDLESILDDCLALSMPSKHLLWHYRSKHESLIAFSNAKFYDNKLLTFPSPDDITSKVQLVQVGDGFYDKGKTRQNYREAELIVQEIEKRLTNSSLSKFSIGVVTFSSAQQNLIDDLLTERYKANPMFESAALECPEPIFVKNLENVQGDERDIILFSIGYGPDQNGKVSLNFGPLNRNGGWRRLNVAVSRARYEMKIFSTLRSDQIDLNKTSAEGVAGLRSFLEFAEKGKSAIIHKAQKFSVNTSAFEKYVAAELEKHGLEVHTNIGCSDYRIDLGIVNPENASEYVLGILCDGHNYHSARTARDREIVQRGVLKQLGWCTHQIWSTDWWANKDLVMKGILNSLSIAKETKSHTLVETLECPIHSQNENVRIVENKIEDYNEEIKPDIIIQSHQAYIIANIERVRFSAEEILNYSHTTLLCDQINQVLDVESPISKDLLCKRVLAAWEIKKLGSRINNHFEQSVFPRLNLIGTPSNTKQFYWKAGQDPINYTEFRVLTDETTKRDADDIAPEEVSNAVHFILQQQISILYEELIRETGRLFGYARSGSVVENSMKRGIQKAIDRGFAREENGRLILEENF